MNQYDILVKELEEKEYEKQSFWEFNVHLWESGGIMWNTERNYSVWDIVFCKVKWNYYLHKVIALWNATKGF